MTESKEPQTECFWTLLNRGDEHMRFSEYQQAFESYDRALTILRSVKLPWNPRFDVESALIGKANALSRLTRHTEALPLYDELLALDESVDGAELTEWHCGIVMNKGLALANAGRRVEAMVCYERVLAVCRREWAKGSDSAGSLLALTIFNIGASGFPPGDFEAALPKFDEALEIYRALTEKQGGKPSVDVAIVLRAKSHALLCLERFEESLTAAKQAVEILEPRADEIGCQHLKLDLSLALLREGRALARLHRHFEASRCFQRSTELVHEVKRRRGTYRDAESAPTESEAPAQQGTGEAQ